jgi:zinc transport system ATP-binding protein
MQDSSNSTDALISANGINVQFADKQVLQSVSLTVREGQILSLIGPNGAGKTTLVRVILGLLAADSGEVRRAPHLRIGYMPQKLHIEPTMPITVRRFMQLSGEKDSTAIAPLLELLKIEHLIGHAISAVSGGELQRILLARALIRKPQLLVLDEPAQGVDVAGQAELYQLIDDISASQKCGVLMISHDLHLVMSATDEVICLNHHICCHGKPEHVSNDPAYLDLFGKKAVESIAVYTHNHNHSHDIKGDIVEHGYAREKLRG